VLRQVARQFLDQIVAWAFIVLAACPFTAPFAVCDVPQAATGIHVYAVASGAAAITANPAAAQIIDNGGARDEQFKDDDEQLITADVVTTSTIEIGPSVIEFLAPPVHLDQSARPPLLALRL
jgi:hypothetical protein